MMPSVLARAAALVKSARPATTTTETVPVRDPFLKSMAADYPILMSWGNIF
jgi:hypothetical protein